MKKELVKGKAFLCISIDLETPITIESYHSLIATISRFEVEFKVNFRVLSNYESVKRPSHKHSIC